MKKMPKESLNLKWSLLASFLATSLAVSAAQFSFNYDNDLSRPTFGLKGPTSSQVNYDEKNGLNMKGAINDILGPPIKMVNGFGNIFEGSKMAGEGASLKSGGALLGIDAKLLEAAGGAHLLKGGLLFGGGAAKTGASAIMKGPAGKKISSIIEVPVKVVAMKDIAAGKALTGIGKMKAAEALAAKSKGATMIRDGEAMKQQGMNQVVQGATEGMQNIGNMVQQTTENFNTAYKLLPIVLDLPMQQQQQQVQQVPIQQQQQQVEATKTLAPQQQQMHMTPNGLLTGLTSLIPGLNADAFSVGNQGNKQPFNLFGQNNHNGYAALLNATNPFATLLMNPSLNPLLMPLSSGPLAQSIMGKAPSASMGNPLAGIEQKFTQNIFPGIKYSETSSSHPPTATAIKGAPVQQQVQQTSGGKI